MNPRITLLGYLCLCVCLLALWPMTARATDDTFDFEERALLSRINEYRLARGLATLQASHALTRSAAWMANDMAARHYFDHTDSARRNPFKRMAAFGYDYKSQRGENVAAGYDDAARIFELWKNSPEHHRIMVETKYRVIGIARAQSSHSGLRWIWVADFGSFVDTTMNLAERQLLTVNSVNAATGQRAIVPSGLAIAAGEGLSDCAAVANTKRLPTQICDRTVMVNGKAAQLYSVSPQQLHYVVPPETRPGEAVIEVVANNSVIASGKVLVEDGRFGLDKLSLSSGETPNQLVVYGSGLRECARLKQLEVKVNQQSVNVRYANAQENSSGLDQLSLELPEALQREATLHVALWVDGKPTAPVSVKAIRSNQRGAAPAEGTQ